MCGIGGILRTDGQPIPEEWLDIIDARIAYRGPDGCGRFRDRVEIVDEKGQKRSVEVAFVHRRLSIIDHASGGQPMVSERGRNDKEGLVAVVFNGCIYNHRELRRELESQGHKFDSDHSDTEVLIHGWREWGERLVDHLEGMYAIALWDHQRATLWLARDAFGEKPLYYRHPITNRGESPIVAFSSEAASLGSYRITEDAANYFNLGQWTQSYLQFGYVLPDLPVVGCGDVDVFQVLPFHAELFPATHRRGRTPGLAYGSDEAPMTEALAERLLDQAVQRRLEADVPIGCFLSGGVDSSMIAFFARKHVPNIHSFNVRMPDPRFDESAHAHAVADYLQVEHATLDVIASPSADLLHLIGLLGQPFGDSSILPTYWISSAARRHVKVALAGDGGDEMFMGYERYRAARMLAKAHPALNIPLAGVLMRAHPNTRLHKLGRLAGMAHDFPRLGVLATESIFDSEQIEALTGEELESPILCARGGGDAAATLRNLDIWCYLPGDLLRKVDTASMACGLEVRCPFLDRDLARAALSTPIDQLMPRGQRKGLLRNIARKYLPKKIVDRPKMGFAIPIGEWFRDDDLPHKGSGMKTLLLDHLNSAEPFGPIHLNRKAVQRFIDEHMSGKRDHGQRLFTLLTLSIWARQTRQRIEQTKGLKDSKP